MKTEFRNRAFLPLVMPLAILAAIGAVVGLVALILLYVDRQGAIAIAFMAAAGVLVAIALSASQGPAGPAPAGRGRRGRPGARSIVGGLVAAGALGGLADADRNINVEPHGPQFIIPGLPSDDTVPVMAAESLQSFCLPSGGGCEDTNSWEMTQSEAEQFAYAFDNRDPQTEHNLMIYNVDPAELDGLDGALPLADVQANYRGDHPGRAAEHAPGRRRDLPVDAAGHRRGRFRDRHPRDRLLRVHHPPVHHVGRGHDHRGGLTPPASKDGAVLPAAVAALAGCPRGR